jgi:uracil-DNA glycosylase
LPPQGIPFAQFFRVKRPSTARCEPTGSALDFFPARISLPQLSRAAKACRGCDLYCTATQTVFGEGPPNARVMFIGEQPGDQEDRTGKPFVGPAGRMLDDMIQQVGIPRDEVYVTNAVKHFKFEPRGKRRIHSKPSAREVAACRPWLEAEIRLVQPPMIVSLGATAARSLLGSSFRLTKHRHELIENPWAPWMLATMHPSALLRMSDDAAREQAKEDFLKDMKIVAKQLQKDGLLRTAEAASWRSARRLLKRAVHADAARSGAAQVRRAGR